MNELVTELLMDLRAGGDDAVGKLWPLLHKELRQLAGHYMHGQPAHHTLQATALVNEAFLKLVNVNFRGQTREEFLAMASQVMRSILVDHARKRSSAKRGAGAVQVTMGDLVSAEVNADEILQVDEVLQRLAGVDERMGRIVELKVFGGLTYDEIAALLKVSSATVRADMRFGLAWLRKEMDDEPDS